MSSSSTFGSFGTVRLGIYAAQKGLEVTGNNITNINTDGYTRQRLDQVSLMVVGGDKTYSPYRTRVGQGVLTTGVSQLRDPALDITYRNASADLGAVNEKLKGLLDIASVLDEVGKGDGEQDDGLLLSQLNDLRDLINKAMANGVETYDGLIRTAASNICNTFHSLANALQEKMKKYETELNNQVDTINSCLTRIRDLNESISKADMRGDDALELRDERNRVLDELSQYVKIDVTYDLEDVGSGKQIERLNVSLATGSRMVLVQGDYATRFSLSQPALNPSYGKPYLTDAGVPTDDPARADSFPRPNPGFGKAYLDERGRPVAEQALAAREPKVNPQYGLIYIGKDGQPTSNKADANEIPRPNPNYDAEDPNSKPYLDKDGQPCDVGDAAMILERNPKAGGRYLMADGTPTNSTIAAEKVLVLNPHADKRYLLEDGTPTDDMTLALELVKNPDADKPYLDSNGRPTADASAAAPRPVANPNYDASDPSSLPYLDKNGNPTGDFTQAASSKNENYRITLSPLANADGVLISYGEANAPERTPGYQDGTTLDPSGKDLADVGDLYGALQSTRELLTERGEYTDEDWVENHDPDGGVKRGIPYYQDALDNLAREFAEQMNALNQTYKVAGDQNSGLADKAGNLFSNSSTSNNTDNITAANISTSKDWNDQKVSIQAKSSGDAPSGDNSNLAKFLAAFETKYEYDPADINPNAVGKEPFEGTFEEMLLRMQSVLAEDQMATNSMLNNYSITYNEVYLDRDSVMGVDLNDEATNLMTYQKAYTAACRLMTVLEQTLDTLINEMLV